MTPLPNIALTSANATQTRCQNVAIANITYNVTDATGAFVSGLPAGVTGNYLGGVFTISGTPTVAGTFNYTVTTSGGCAPADTASGTLTVTPLPNIALTSANATQTRCQNVAIANITYNVTDATGAFVSGLPAGVTGNYLGGVFTISGTPTVAGTFNYTVTTSGGCAPADTASGTLTVTPLPTATINYSGTPFCKSLGTAQSVTLTGTNAYTGGSYSSIPVGLTINAGTGAITPSTSTAGTYTVTYTIPASGGCATIPVTTNVTITAIPTATISYAGTPFCKSLVTAQNVTLNGTGAYTGGIYSSVPAGLTINTSTGAITPSTSTAGTYTVTYTIPASGGCATVPVTTMVTITAVPTAIISYSATSYCKSDGNQNINLSGTGAYTGGTYSASPAGLTINASGRITPSTSTAGTYTVTYTIPANGGCAAVPVTTTVTITDIPTATISYAGTPFCKSLISGQSVTLNGTGAYTGGTYTAAPAGLIINASTGDITPSTSTAGTYTVTYTIPASGGCAAVPVTTSVTITAVPTAIISYAGTPFCRSVATAQNVTRSGTGAFTGGTYSASPAGLTINAGTGAITPNTSTAGTYTVTYTIPASGGCAAVPVTTSVTITAIPTATISYAGTPFCKSLVTAQNVTLNGTGTYTGGTYTAAPAGLTINVSTGDITPSTSTAGTYTVTYTIPASGGCAAVPVTTSVTITAVPTAIINYAGTPFCRSVATAQNVTRSGTGAFTGGTYSASPAGLTINAGTGAITPNTSTAGTYTVTYTIPASGGCAAVPVTTSVTITAIPTATISYAGTPFCKSLITAQNVTLNGTGAYTGGTYTAAPAGLTINASTGDITPSTSNAGTYTVTYTIPASGGCAAVPVTTSVTITDVPTATISYTGSPYCTSVITAQNVTLSGTGSYSGGTFSASPAGLSINPSTGAITPNGSATGTYTVTYATPVSGGCSSVTTNTTIVIDIDPVGGTLSLSNSSTITSVTECFTASGTLYLSGHVGTIAKWQYSITAGTSWVDIANTGTTYAYSGITQNTIFRAVIQNSGGCAAYPNGCVIFIIPNIKPSPVTATPSTICAGDSSVLSSTSGYATNVSLASGGSFSNSNPPGWTVDSCTNNCLNAGASNTNPGPWQLSATNGGTYSGTTYTSIGKFAIVNGNFNSQLYTPTFNTFGLTTASLTFTQAYNLGAGATATVEISANGGPWITLATYTGSSGVPSYTNFIPMTINLNAYINQPNLKIRFNYSGTTGSSWAVDNIQIPDVPSNLSTQWVDATTGVVISNNATITVTPLVTTTYAVISSLNGCNSFGTDGTAYVTVTVFPRPTARISQDQVVCMGDTATFSVALTGRGPWSMTYSDGTTPTTVNNILTNPYIINVPNITTNKTYTITALRDVVCTAIGSDIAGSATVTVLNGTQGLWTGLVSTDWFDCKNWAGGLPSATVDAQIPTGATRMPVIDPSSPFAAAYSFIAIGRDIIINSGASVTMMPNSNLHVKRDWRNSGSFIPGTGTVTFNGATNNQVQLINSGIKLDETFYNVTLNSTNGAKGVSVADGFKLTIANSLLLTSGDLRLTGEAQLVQNGNAANPSAGTGKLLRDQQGTKSSYHYNYWSSPVSADNLNYTVGGVLRDGTNAAANPFNPGTITFGWGYDFSDGPLTSPIKISNRWLYKYTAVSASYFSWQLIESTGSVKVGEGFTMKGVTGLEPSTNYQNYVFTGKPNNGDINLTMAMNQLYLIGNPYPSALDANAFIMDNVLDNGAPLSNAFNGALYFWDHFGGQTHYLSEYIGGYATYTLIGGTVAISNDPLINNNNATGTKVPQRYIPVAQGFFVRTDVAGVTGISNPITGGTIKFRNSQRAFKTESPANSVFFKSANSTASEDIDNRQKIRLSYETASGLRRQLLVGADTNTSNQFDIGYDAPMIDVNKDDMYWTISNGKFVIQGVPDFSTMQILPLGIKVTTPGIGKIKIDALENLPASTEIYLFDSTTGIYHNIKNQEFSTDLPIGEYNDRFSLRFTTETLSSEEVALNNGIMVFTDSNHILNIKNNITDVRVTAAHLYNILGQSVAKWNITEEDQRNIKIPVEHIRSGTYIIKLKTSDGSLSKQVIIR